MYLVDTDVISELRKGPRADSGVRNFFATAERADQAMYLSAITLGELRRGIELVRHRRDLGQAVRLEEWLELVIAEFDEHILEFGFDEAQVWGKLMAPHPENPLDEQIAATALTRGLKFVTRNATHFGGTGVEVVNPFSDAMERG